MRKFILSILFCALPLLASAQVKFGYLSYSQALQSMPDYALAKENLAKLEEQFETEMKRAEEEFNKKYEEFLEGQQEFAVSIRNKRQSELQELMQKNMAFKQEARRLLKNAEADAMKPLHESWPRWDNKGVWHLSSIPTGMPCLMLILLRARTLLR